MSASDPESGIHPRSVTPGIETHPDTLPPPGVYCRLDWIRFTGVDVLAPDVAELLRLVFGDATKLGNGAAWFSKSTLWEPGVMLSTGHRSEILQVDIQGSRLATLPAQQGIDLALDLAALGLKPTRLDVAIDWIDQDADLYRHALSSCEARELCRLRTYDPSPSFSADGRTRKRLLKLGQRDSAICVRIYDKGLESAAAPIGRWERFEAEFKSDRARTLLGVIAASSDPIAAIAARALGSVDFREANGRSELKRRPRSSWWCTLTDGLDPRPTPAMGTDSTLESWVSAFRTGFGRRILQVAHQAGVSPVHLFEMLIAELAPATSTSGAVGALVRAIVDGSLPSRITGIARTTG